MRRSRVSLMLPGALVAALALAGCGGDESKGGGAPAAGPGASAAAKLPDSSAGLESLVATWKAAHQAGDQAALMKLAADVIPTTADLKAVLKEGAATDDFLGKFAAKDLKADDPMIGSLAGGLFKPEKGQTEVKVHAATTEDLVAYAKGTPAFEEFPGGMQRFAALVKPKVTWYVVELLEPGKDLGMKFTAFVHAGGRFVFVAKPWRAVAGGDK